MYKLDQKRSLFLAKSLNGIKNFDWDGKDDGVAGVATDIVDAIEGTEVEGTRRFGEFGGCFGEVLASHKLALAIDDGGSFLTFSLGLFGHGADHTLR